MVNNITENIKSTINEKVRVVTIAKALILSYIITIPLFVIFALILSYTNFPEKYMSTAVIVTTLISLLVAGSFTTRDLKSKGWLNGAVSGFLYMLVLYIVSSIVFGDFSVDRYVLTMFAVGILSGAIGGIIGINLKSGSSKHRTRVSVKQKK